MTYAAALALADYAEWKGLREGRILPSMDDWRLAVPIAVATAMKAQEQGLARVTMEAESYRRSVQSRIAEVRRDVHRVLKTETSAETSDEYAMHH